MDGGHVTRSDRVPQVSAIVIWSIEDLDLKMPTVSKEQPRRLIKARQQLEREG